MHELAQIRTLLLSPSPSLARHQQHHQHVSSSRSRSPVRAWRDRPSSSPYQPLLISPNTNNNNNTNTGSSRRNSLVGTSDGVLRSPVSVPIHVSPSPQQRRTIEMYRSSSTAALQAAGWKPSANAPISNNNNNNTNNNTNQRTMFSSASTPSLRIF
jgi:hypothetical protein